MAFQIKDFASIVASCINWMRASNSKITDYNVGSVARTLLEAPAAEIDELYQQMFIGLKEAIPVSVYNSFDFEKLGAATASGLVRVTVTSDSAARVIPAGTSFFVPGRTTTYESISDTTIPASATFVDVTVVATAEGSIGNIPSGLAFRVAPAPSGFVSAVNLAAFSGGRDEETDEERKLRFIAYIGSLNRGTVAALRYAMSTVVLYDAAGLETERVQYSAVVEPWLSDANQPVGLVRCYIHNGVGGTTTALVNRTKDVIYGYEEADGTLVPGWKAAGVNVEVIAATQQTLNVTAVLTAASGYSKSTLVSLAQSEIYEYIASLPIGATAIRSEMIALAMNIDGVTNFTVSAPTGDTTAAVSVKLMPGTITIT